MSDKPPEYSLKESDRFVKQLKALHHLLGEHFSDQIEEKINSIRWALTTKPTVYQIVPERPRLRMAATRRDKNIPRLRFLFVIDEDNKSVEIKALDVDTTDVFM